MRLTLWRSVRQANVSDAFNGEGAARFPGRFNLPGMRAVYLADCPAGCALELVANYAAPEALDTQMLFRVELDADLIDLRRATMQRRYNATLAQLTTADDYSVARRVAKQLHDERRPGAVTPSATVNAAFNVVVFPDLFADFVVDPAIPLVLTQPRNLS